MKEPKVRVFENLERMTGYRAIALPHINEIHVDAKIVNTPIGTQILNHERKHLVYARRMAKSKHPFWVALLNNIWDFVDVNRIELLQFLYWLKHRCKKFNCGVR